MKLAKLSLAAIVAAGALTTVNAKPLEEAIKGVDFSGMLRYRLNQKEVESVKSDNHNDWDFLAKFTAPVTEDIKAVMAFASNSGKGVNQSGSSVSSLNVDLAKAFFVYSKDALTVKAGMQAFGHPIFDNGFNGNKGNGVVAMYNAGPVTLAGAYFAGIGGPGINLLSSVNGDEADVAAVAVIGSMGPVSAQVWYVTIQDVVDGQFFVQADGKFAMVNVTGQFINTKIDDRLVPAAATDDSGNYYALKVGADFAPVTVNVGYTKNDDKQGHYSVAGADSAVIHPGWRLGYEIDNVADAESYFADVTATFGKYSVMVAYANAEVPGKDYDEIQAKVGYQVSKNLNTYVRYSTMDIDNGTTSIDSDYLRFEANYSF